MFYNNSECYKTSDTSYTIAFYTFKNDGSNSFPISMLSYIVTPTSVSLDRSYNLGLTTSGSGYGLLSNDGNYKTLKTINGQDIFGSGDITIEGGETLTEADILAMGFTKNAGTITGVSANGTSVATSGVANIPAASTSKYGVTKLSSATDSTSTSLAATASAVKAAYDLAKGKVSESDIFENKTDGIIKAEALYNDKSQGGLVYALPTSHLVEDGDYDDILASHTQIFYGNAQNKIHKVEGFNDVDSQGLIYALPNTRLADSGDYDEIIATESYVDRAVANAGGSGSGSYVPMPETFVEQGASINHTLLPNSSVYCFLVGSGAVRIYLQQPTSFDVMNEYTMIFRTFGFGNAITIDKTIIWANDNSPVLDDSVAEILEISVKCINAPAYDGVQYLGTWAKYSI